MITMTELRPQVDAVPAVPVPVRAAHTGWANRFTLVSAGVLALVFLGVSWPAWKVMVRFSGENQPNLSAVVALEMMLLGTLVVFAAIWLVLIELRGRARLVDVATGAQPYRGGGVGRSVPEILRATGQLRAPVAMFVLAAALFLGSTAIGWRNLPDLSGPTAVTPAAPMAPVQQAPSAQPSPSASVR